MMFIIIVVNSTYQQEHLQTYTNKKNKIKKQDSIHIGLSLNIVISLAHFLGQEYIGSEKNEKQNIMIELTEIEGCQYVEQIKLGEKFLEEMMLLYENIYSNIYYQYTMCGQVQEILTLLDIEEAFSIPVILQYAKEWTNQSDAYNSILQFMQDLTKQDLVEQNKYKEDQFVFDIEKCQEDISLSKMMEKLKMSKLNFGQTENFSLLKPENQSNNAENQLFHNQYNRPSNQQIHGLICAMTKKEFEKYSYLTNHLNLTAQNDIVYVYLPKLVLKSQITGNIHRLSFSQSFSGIKNSNLRRIRLIAMISFARTLFPLSIKIENQFNYPLVQLYSFKFENNNLKLQLSKNLRISYLPNFYIMAGESNSNNFSTNQIYKLAPYLLSTIQNHDVDNQFLQYFHTEYLIMKLSDGNTNTKIHIFLKAINAQKLNAIQRMKSTLKIDQNQIYNFEKDRNVTINDNIVFNALSVVISCGILDKRCSEIDYVIETLIQNQYLVENNRIIPNFSTYLEFMLDKMRLYQINFNQQPNLQSMITNGQLLYNFMGLINKKCQGQTIYNFDNQKLLVQYIIGNYCTYQNLLNMTSKEIYSVGIEQLMYTTTINNYSEQNDEVDIKIESLTKIFSDNLAFPQYDELFNQYHFNKLSNFCYYLNKFIENKLYEKKKSKNNFNILHAKAATCCFIQIITQIDQHVQTDRQYAESENQSIFSKQTTQIKFLEFYEQHLNQHKSVFDINFSNPAELDDYIQLVNDYYKAWTNDIFYCCDSKSSNTPEFLINAIKNDYIETHKNYQVYQYIVFLNTISKIHSIKLNDTTVRNEETISYIIPRIQIMQEQMEKMIIQFLQDLKDTHQIFKFHKEIILLKTVNAIEIIELYIKKLQQARTMILKRQNLSEDHQFQIQNEINRALRGAFGVNETIIQHRNLMLNKEQMLEKCEMYAGNDGDYKYVIIDRLEQQPRCGGANSHIVEPFQRHITWKKQFPWENKKEKIEKLELIQNLKQKSLLKQLCFKTKSWCVNQSLFLSFTITSILGILCMIWAKNVQLFSKTLLSTIQKMEQRTSNSLFLADSFLTYIDDQFNIKQIERDNFNIQQTTYNKYTTLLNQLYLTETQLYDISVQNNELQGFDVNMLKQKQNCSCDIYNESIKLVSPSIVAWIYPNLAQNAILASLSSHASLLDTNITLSSINGYMKYSIFQYYNAVIKAQKCIINSQFNEFLMNYTKNTSFYIQKQVNLANQHNLQFKPCLDLIVTKIGVAEQISKSVNIICISVICSIGLFFAFRTTNIKLQQRITSNSVDKGSIIQQISNLNKIALQKIIEYYKALINPQTKLGSLEMQSFQQKKQINEENFEQKLLIDFMKSLQKLFQKPNPCWSIILLIVIVFIFIVSMVDGLDSFKTNYKTTSINIENLLNDVEINKIKYFTPSHKSLNLSHNIISRRILSSQSSKYQLESQNILQYILDYIDLFDLSPITSNTQQHFQSIPYPQIIYLLNRYTDENSSKMIKELKQSICKIERQNKQNIQNINNMFFVQNLIYNQDCDASFTKQFSNLQIEQYFNKLIDEENKKQQIMYFVLQIISTQLLIVINILTLIIIIRYILRFQYQKNRDKDLVQLTNSIFGSINYSITTFLVALSFLAILTIEIQIIFVFNVFTNSETISKSFEFTFSCVPFLTLFTITIFLLIVLDSFCSNALVIVCSLGIPEKNQLFSVPYDLNIKHQIQPTTWIKSIIFILIFTIFSFVTIYPKTSVNAIILSQSVSVQNLRAISAYQTLSDRYNQLLSYQEYFEFKAMLYETYITQNRENYNNKILSTQFENLVNIKDLLRYNDLLWDSQNPIRQSLDFGAQKSQAFIMELIQLNYTQFMQTPPPRSIKIDENLIPNPEGEYIYELSIASITKMHFVITGMLSKIKQLNFSDQSNISPLNNQYQPNFDLSDQERLIVSFINIKQRLLQYLNKAYNDFADTLLSASQQDFTNSIYFQQVVILSIIIVLTIIAIILVQYICNNALVDIMKNNLFSGLLLKKLIQLLKPKEIK